MKVKGSKQADRLPFITVISNRGFRPVLFRIAPRAPLHELEHGSQVETFVLPHRFRLGAGFAACSLGL